LNNFKIRLIDFAKRNQLVMWSVLLLLLISTASKAQKNVSKSVYHPPSIAVKLDTTNYLIGTPIHLDFFVTEISDDTKVLLPEFESDSLASVDVVAIGAIDSSANTLHQRITLMAFDSGALYLPSYKILYAHQGQTDSLFSIPLSFHVKGLQIDTMKTFHSIKKPMDIVKTWREYLLWIVIGLVGLIVIAVLIYFLMFKKGMPLPILRTPAPEVPAYEWALQELKKLDIEKLPVQNQSKLYYTRLTDILRIFIEKQYHLAAMESTTDELMDLLKKQKFSSASRQQMKAILQAADLVKFAKGQPLQQDMDQHLHYAESFIVQAVPSTPKLVTE